MKVDRGTDDEGRAWVRIHGGEHVIERAWCVERAALTTIDEAREAYFDLPSAKGKKPPRFHFLCPDARCREAFAPTISGVNHDKSADHGDIYVNQPHFRWVEARAHSADCFLVAACLGAPARVPRDRPSAEGDGARRESAPKEHDTIDLYVLPPDDDAGYSRGNAGDDDKESEDEGRGPGRDAHRAATARPTRTTRLSRLFNHYKSLAKNFRAFNTYLTFGEERMKYGDWFQPIRAKTKRAVKPWIGGPARFWWGNAKPRPSHGVWRLEFYEPFLEDGEEYPVTLTLREDALKHSPVGRENLRVLRAARDANGYVAACFLGTLEWDIGPEGEAEVGGLPESITGIAVVPAP